MGGDGVQDLGEHLGLQGFRPLLDQAHAEVHMAEEAALRGR
jgi:hypothetical protein